MKLIEKLKLHLWYKKQCKIIDLMVLDLIAPLVVFKVDDLYALTDEVKKLDSIVQSEDICVSWGFIGNSLENPNKRYLSFIKDKLRDVHYHFFNHGYLHLWDNDYEFYDKPYEGQFDYFKKTQDKFKEFFNHTLDSFGAPCNRIDSVTSKVLNGFDEIRYWYYGLKESNKIVLNRNFDIEKTVGTPDFDFFKKNLISFFNIKCSSNLDAEKLNIEKDNDNAFVKSSFSSDTIFFANYKGVKKPLIVLQMHPNKWDDRLFYEFKLCLRLLKKMNSVFVNPNDLEFGE